MAHIPVLEILFVLCLLLGRKATYAGAMFLAIFFIFRHVDENIFTTKFSHISLKKVTAEEMMETESAATSNIRKLPIQINIKYDRRKNSEAGLFGRNEMPKTQTTIFVAGNNL